MKWRRTSYDLGSDISDVVIIDAEPCRLAIIEDNQGQLM